MFLKSGKADINLAASKILQSISIIVASAYLTFVVDVYTLNTVLKRIFVFGYFLIICLFFAYLQKRIIRKKLTVKAMILLVCIVGLILALFQSAFLPIARGGTIMLRAQMNGEIWLVNAEIDGQTVPLTQLEINENCGWEYNADYDDYVFYPYQNSADNYLSIHYPAESVHLYFAENPWSGSVFIADENGNETVLELHSEYEKADQYSYSIINEHKYSFAERAVLNLGAFIIIWNFFSCICSFVNIGAKLSWEDKSIVEYRACQKKAETVSWDIYSCTLFLAIVVWRIFLMLSFHHPYITFPDSGGYMDFPWYDFFHFIRTSNRTPVYPAFLSILKILFGESQYLYIVPILQAMLSLICLLFFYKTLILLTHNKWIANLVTLLYGMNPDIIVWDSVILTESIAISLTILFLYLVVKYIDDPSLKTGISTIVLSLVMIFERPSFLLFAGLLFAFWILRIILCKGEYKILFQLCIISIFSFILVLTYAVLFAKTFGYYNITDAMPRQNLVNIMVRGYYINSEEPEFSSAIESALNNNGGEIWPAVYEILDKYGQSETNRLSKKVLYSDLLRYAKDNLKYMLNDTKETFARYYLYTARYSPEKENELSTVAINALCNMFELRIIWLYVFLFVEFISLLKQRNCEKKFWIHLGLFTFMLLISTSTYIATCGEYNRTMIHVVPFVYLSIAMTVSAFSEQYMCLNKGCDCRGQGGKN